MKLIQESVDAEKWVWLQQLAFFFSKWNFKLDMVTIRYGWGSNPEEGYSRS
jgi:hypothetical protein